VTKCDGCGSYVEAGFAYHVEAQARLAGRGQSGWIREVVLDLCRSCLKRVSFDDNLGDLAGLEVLLRPREIECATCGGKSWLASYQKVA